MISPTPSEESDVAPLNMSPDTPDQPPPYQDLDSGHPWPTPTLSGSRLWTPLTNLHLIRILTPDTPDQPPPYQDLDSGHPWPTSTLSGSWLRTPLTKLHLIRISTLDTPDQPQPYQDLSWDWEMRFFWVGFDQHCCLVITFLTRATLTFVLICIDFLFIWVIY